MSRGSYLSGGGRGTRPARVVSLVVRPEYRDITTCPARGAPLRFGSACVADVVWQRNRWSSVRLTDLRRVGSVLAYIHSLGRPHTTTHIVCPIASDTMTHVRFWEWLDAQGARWAWGSSPPVNTDADPTPAAAVVVRRCVLRGTPDIVEYRFGGCTYRWVSGSNYYRETEESVAEAIGYRWPSSSPSTARSCPSNRPIRDRAELWCRALMHLADWWAPLAAGRWPVSIPSASYSYLKSRLPKRVVSTHKDERVIPLEREACHGGRTTCWYYGDIRPDVGTSWSHPELPGRSPWGEMPGPVYHWDVSSMYPALMRDGHYPVRLKRYAERPEVAELRELLDVYECVARVTLRTELPEYPCRHGGRIVYPVGTWTTTLAGEELRQAVTEGSVQCVHSAAYYWRGRPFVRAATELLQMRADAKASGNKGWELLTKMVCNSVTGKLAQRRGTWVPVPEAVVLQRWGEWIEVDRVRQTRERWQARAGLAWRWDDSARGTGTVTAAYACLTAAGRMMMRRLRELLPDRSVIAQATDGVWLTAAGHRVLSSLHPTTSPVPGQPRLVGSATVGRWLDATHYVADGQWTLAGFASSPAAGAALAVTDTQTTNPVRLACDSPPNITWERYRDSTLTALIREGGVTPDGWLTPYRLPGRGPRADHGPGE